MTDFLVQLVDRVSTLQFWGLDRLEMELKNHGLKIGLNNVQKLFTFN